MPNTGDSRRIEGVAQSGEQQLGLTRFSPVGKLVQRVGRRMDLVTRLLHEESSPNGLTAEQAGLPAGTLRKFGRVECAWCPPGKFMMGSPESEEGRLDDEIQHPVTLTNGFWMSCCPVIQADYQAVVGSNPSRFIGIDSPVEQVSWEEAVEFCRKLTLKQREEGMLPERWEWRLPTEAEWEYAARAGETAARHGELEAIAWSFLNADRPRPPGWNTPNYWGLHDVIGNISEWCSDWYGDYELHSPTNPSGPIKGKCRVIRGDDFRSSDDWCFRFAAREKNRPETRRDHIGFRPVLSTVG
jgi:formylglycine-generating enzyme required for sulfatase activity